MANYIGNVPASGEFKRLDSIASSFNGTTTQFNLTYGSVSQTAGDSSQLIVSLNGIIQEPLESYTLGIGGSSIVFSSAPLAGDTCHIVLLGGVGSTTTPTDGSVTAIKLDAALKDYYEDEFVANGAQTTYTLSRASIGVNQLMVTIDGIVQPTSAYSAVGTTLTISPALPNGTNVRVVHMGVKAGFYVPPAGSVGLNEVDLTAFDNRYYQSGDNISVGTISATGNVGLGGSPTQRLDVDGNIKIDGANNANVANVIFTRTDASWRIANETDFRIYNGSGNTDNPSTLVLTATSAGRVGIGTILPYYELDVQVSPPAGGYDGINLTDSSETVLGLYKTGSSYSYGNVGANQSWIYSNVGDLNILSDGSGIIKFEGEGGAERARITSTGHFLVGTTNLDIGGSVDGTKLAAAGGINTAISGTGFYDVPIYADRRGTNNTGNILTMGLGGYLKASIGIEGTNNPANDAAITFATISGNNTRTERVRITTEYLRMASGTAGIQFNGDTSAANALDDYEEGTWAAADISGAGLSLTVNRANYTKVGNIVVATISVNYPSTSSTATAYISLPFTQLIYSYYAGNGSQGYTNLGQAFVPVVENRGVQGVLFYKTNGGTFNNSELSGYRIDYTVTYLSA